MKQKTITIVSGLPRSGTSMMMKMMKAGGISVLTDNLRKADEDNPKGYYEFEKVKQIRRDKTWLKQAQGKTVKMVSEFLKYLPRSYNYKVIFMQRKMEEILASQRQMLKRRGKPVNKASDKKMAALFKKHLKEAKLWLGKQPNIEVIYIDYNQVLKKPASQVKKINQFLDGTLDTQAMAKVIDPKLYRQRGS
ncbi:MAG TPA: sulfotransferase domain-containing protein [Patescibacteria group bacterium]|nr:sulfotransferase domain-containing protein [Patescibacteria group bacterium]